MKWHSASFGGNIVYYCHMLFIQTYIEKQLKKARYEFDAETKSWCAWVTSLPGVYAQADTVESVREQLAEVIEDYFFITLKRDGELPGFKWPQKTEHAYA